jgi:hypothetical protein
MAWKGPAGLLGEPETDRDQYTVFPVCRHRQLMVWVHRDILARLDEVRPTPEGDHLFFVEGHGRLRFRLVNESE